MSDVFDLDETKLELKRAKATIASMRSMISNLRREKTDLRHQLSVASSVVLQSVSLPPDVVECIRRICSEEEASPKMLLAGDRHKHTVRARWRIIWEMYAMRRPDGRKRFSSIQLGQYLNMDHASVLHAYKKMLVAKSLEEAA